MSRIVIVDYGAGNILSVGRLLDAVGATWTLSADPATLSSASHLVMPGVGHGGAVMTHMRGTGLARMLADVVLGGGVPVLGICLGMQLMTRSTEEGGADCLSWFNASTVELRPATPGLKVPNMGWHLLADAVPDPLFDGIDLSAEPFYFCHRFGVVADSAESTRGWLEYGSRYAAVVRKGNVVGVQFHPEKSQEAGRKLMRNFLALGRARV